MEKLRLVEDKFASKDDPIVVQLKYDLEVAQRGVESSSNYATFGRQEMSRMSLSHTRQRHMHGDSTLDGAYHSSKKLAMPLTVHKQALLDNEKLCCSTRNKIYE